MSPNCPDPEVAAAVAKGDRVAEPVATAKMVRPATLEVMAAVHCVCVGLGGGLWRGDESTSKEFTAN